MGQITEAIHGWTETMLKLKKKPDSKKKATLEKDVKKYFDLMLEHIYDDFDDEDDAAWAKMEKLFPSS